MTRNLGSILKHLYPNAEPLVDFVLVDAGSGPAIKFWDEAALGPQPTDKEILAAEEATMRTRQEMAGKIAADAMSIKRLRSTPREKWTDEDFKLATQIILERL